MSDSTANTFSYVVGGLALLSTISSLLLYSSAFLPDAQLRVLDELLKETISIYKKAEAEGLLPHEVATESQGKLIYFEGKCENLREITYRAQSLNDKIRIVMQGLSTEIRRLARDVEFLRATLVTTSQRERARRDLEDLSTVVDNCGQGVPPSHSRPNESAESSSPEVSESGDTTTSCTKKNCSYLRCVFSIAWWCSKQSSNHSHPIDAVDEQCSSSQCSDTLSRATTLVDGVPPSSDPRSRDSASPFDRRYWWFRKSPLNSPQPEGDDSNKDVALLPV